jgi:hypothetical protein
MFVSDTGVGWSFNINAGYTFGIFLNTLRQVLFCYKLNQDPDAKSGLGHSQG